MSSVPSDRRLSVEKAARKWANDLVDLGPHNALLRFRDTRATLDLTEADQAALGRLLTGVRVRVRKLFPDSDTGDARVRAARLLRRNALALEEEQGVVAARVGVGLLGGPPPDGRESRLGVALRAPIILRSLTLHGKGRATDDFDLVAEGEPELNPVLVYVLAQQYGMSGVAEQEEKITRMLAEVTEPREQARRAFDELADAARRNGVELTYDDRVVAGVFSYEKLPMVRDLHEAVDLLAGHDLVAAIAGDPAAETAVATSEPVLEVDHDRLPPAGDYCVLPADSSQQRAIDLALAGRNLVIDGPPGTGKSQTIGNLIASLTARGRRVLFVAEKRAAIEAVTQLLDSAGLDGLVFDLHHDGLKRGDVARQIAKALERARTALPPSTDEADRTLTRSRERLADHNREMMMKRAPWGISVLGLLERLAGLPTQAATEIRFRGGTLDGLTGKVRHEIEDLLVDFVGWDGLRIWAGGSPWSESAVATPIEVEDTLRTLDELVRDTLRRARTDLHGLVQRVGLRAPASIAGWRGTVALLHDVTATLRVFGDEVFGDDLDDLWVATGSGSWRKEQGRSMGWWRRWTLTRRARRLCRGAPPRDRADLHRLLGGAVVQRDAWRASTLDRTTPREVADIDVHLGVLQHAESELAAVAAGACLRGDELTQADDAELDSRLARLREFQSDLKKMPEINRARDRFARLGLRPLLDELAERGAEATEARDTFTYAWARSVLEHAEITSPVLRSFTGAAQQRAVTEFQASDEAHAELNVARLLHAVAARLRKEMDADDDQAALVRRAAGRRSGHRPLRELVTQAPDVLLAVFPCWAMSPLNVSRSLPARRLFDVVIFDEASQVEPQDAITSIVRGNQLVVAGDERQLPPSRFFRRQLAGAADWDADEEDEPGGDLGDFESILNRVRALGLDHTRLNWHYRSRDDRLIAFSNHEIYDDDLVTFPGVRQGSPLAFERVDGVTLPGQGSPPQEVRRVVELVREHARTRPRETLGVITFGDKHRDRVQMALDEVKRTDDALAALMSEDRSVARRFFVKNLERVQGDERDAIILSPGYTKQPSGAPPRLGPLSHAGGERRLNVAVTRARTQMTVVASFGPGDLRPEGAKHRGPELLRRFLNFADGRSRERPSGHATGAPMNDLERKVYEAMQRAGLEPYPQWGASGYRIDFALPHPGQPGRMVLAVEIDGARYHSSPTARDRDRLRQKHLEGLGWHFHRVWSLEWFRDPETELARIVAARDEAVQAVDQEDAEMPGDGTDSTGEGGAPQNPPPREPGDGAGPPAGHPRGPRPELPRYPSIRDYSGQQLTKLCVWLLSDDLELDAKTRIRQAMNELGLKRETHHVTERVGNALRRAEEHRNAERGGR